MFFRNLTMQRFPEGFDLSELEGLLAERKLRPVGALEMSSSGFVPPLGRISEAMTHQVGGAVWICVGTETRILPSAVVNAELQKKIEAFEQQQGRLPGSRMRRTMKDDLMLELLPRAFVTPSRVHAMFDLKRSLLVVDTASRKVAEAVASELRQAIGTFPALPLTAETAPMSVLTGWIAGDLPEGLCAGDECELKELQTGGAKVRCQRQELHSNEVTVHLEAGKQVARVALTLKDRVSFVVGEDLVVRKLKLLDVALESLEQTDGDDLRAELDARFALMAGEFGQLFDFLDTHLRFSRLV